MSDKLTTLPETDDALAFIKNPSPEALQAVIGAGDLSKLSATQRLEFVNAVCRSTGLNVLTRPFEFITLNGKLTMYARKDATDQLRKLHGVSIEIVEQKNLGDLLMMRAKASMPNGRSDESVGALSIAGLKGEALANAYMKCESKAKRRVTLSICGLGLLDESEIEGAQAEQEETKPASRTILADGSRPTVDTRDVTPVDVIPPAEPKHWSELLPDAWREVTVPSGGKLGDLRSADPLRKKLMAETESGLLRMALDASIFAEMQVRVDGKGGNMQEFEQVLLDEGILAEDEQLLTIEGGKRLEGILSQAKAWKR